MWCNYSITDLITFESEGVAVELDEHETRVFAVRMADKLPSTVPDLKGQGMCVVVYDIDEQPVSIVPLDPIQ
jgi:hypothetical protein